MRCIAILEFSFLEKFLDRESCNEIIAICTDEIFRLLIWSENFILFIHYLHFDDQSTAHEDHTRIWGI